MSQKLVFSIAKMIFNVTINGFLLSQIVSFLMLQKKKRFLMSQNMSFLTSQRNRRFNIKTNGFLMSQQMGF